MAVLALKLEADTGAAMRFIAMCKSAADLGVQWSLELVKAHAMQLVTVRTAHEMAPCTDRAANPAG